MKHAEIEGLLGAYALDAVDPREAREVESHLVTCEACLREVAEFHEVSALLTESVDEAPQLWDRIAAEIETSERPVPGWYRWAVAAAVAVALVGLAGLVASQQTQLVDLQEALDAERATVGRQATLIQARSPEGQLSAALADPAARLITLDGDHGSVAFVVLPDGSAFVAGNTLPALGPDRTYQLWAVTEGQVVSAALLGGVPQTTQLRIEGAVEILAITEEVIGGVVVSQEDPAAVWLADA